MKKLLGIAMAAMLVFGIAGQASADFEYGNLHFVAIEDSDGTTKHDAADGTYEYHVDLGDFNATNWGDYTGTGDGEALGMFEWSGTVDTVMTLGDFDATSWDDIYFAAYGWDALWYGGTEYTTSGGNGMVFTSAVQVTADNLSGSAAIQSLWTGTDGVDEGQYEMDNADSYLSKNSDPELGNYNDFVNISGEFWNAELVGLGDTYLYGFNYTDDGEASLALLGTFTLSLDATDNSLLIDYTPVPVPASVLLLGSGLLGLFGIRRKRS
ncbi:MAG: VPLPA-CTERM sorting domain-containing protein [Desulfobacteraceae bacterium]|jgi:hypothetical protein